MANQFLQSSVITDQNSDLDYINYDSIREDNKEFLLSNVWDFKWTTVPAAVYFPGNPLLKVRTTSVTPQFNIGITQMMAIVRQFTIQQSVITGTTAGSISFEYVDKEDQAITAWLWDWREKMGGMKDRFLFRKEDTIGEGVLTMYNSTRRPIRIYTLRTMQPIDIGNTLNPQFNSDDANNNNSMASATFAFEHWELNWANME